MKSRRIATKIGTETNFGTANSKIVVPSPENLQKFGTYTKFGTTNSKIMLPKIENHPNSHAHAPPLKNETCSDEAENWY